MVTGKIAFEEHYAIDETVAQVEPFVGDSPTKNDFIRKVLDLGDERLEGMARNGIDFAILSLNSAGIQQILDTGEAVRIARRANDVLADAVSRHPDKYGAFAALPMQDSDQAAAELQRCVRDLGFLGGLVNGFTQKDTLDSAIYYDVPEYRSFWSTVSELDVPIYLHPRMQLESRSQNLQGHPWLKSAPWGFAVETSIHALRLCGSGLFDEFPNLKIGIGHLGENIPFALERMDERMRFSRRGYRGRRLLGEYFRDHFYVTTSGNFSDPAFRCALEVMGIDHLCFSSDYPFERMEDGCSWFDATAVISDEERVKIGRENAIKLFKLSHLT